MISLTCYILFYNCPGVRVGGNSVCVSVSVCVSACVYMRACMHVFSEGYNEEAGCALWPGTGIKFNHCTLD